jgi:uncharacterized circularly permuted ATP-grasp superfamily protein/uncharacterized alpha-E superfamily protein
MIVKNDTNKDPLTYSPVEGHWDEALLPSGFPRRHWRPLFVEIGRMGFEHLSRRWQSGQQFIQSQGVTYNVGNLPDGNEYAWPMDPIPLVIDENEWASIEQAAIQRATLLNAVLRDLYSEQRLLHQHLLPSALAFANPHFLRPCFGIVPAGGVHLHTFAMDIARSSSGTWWVIADRTQAPSGLGYTLQNRLLSARTLPGVFDQCRVRQLANFYDVKRDALSALAGDHQHPDPTVVLLTAGPHNETYFEHSFLAGQWGFTLVEGADLTVLDRRVYLKTLGGLKPVDVILRRLDDAFCDPLELRGDSLLGVPGLVEAVRSGTVVIDNALGSGLVETPANMAFLPGLCRHILSEDLRMPSVATWWCGQEEPRQYVIEHLKNLVIKPAFARFGQHPEFPQSMSAAETEELIRRIEAHPENFVAQERVALSTVPVRTDAGLAPRHVVLRVYAAWNGQSYTVLPGGLTRVSRQESSFVVSMQLGGGSKDTWVLGETAQAASAGRQASVHIPIEQGAEDLPSRVADNLFWLGRYSERVESRVRFVRALWPALSSEEDFGRAVSLETAIRMLSGLGYLAPATASTSLGEQRWAVQRVLTEVVYDSSQTSSLRWNLKELRRVSWHLKERLSSDTWRVLQQLDSQFSGFAPANPDQRYFGGLDLLDSVVLTLSAFSGLLMENTTRGSAWRFLEIGRRMERALQAAEMLGSTLDSAGPELEPCLQVLLQIADSSITYRRRYSNVLQTRLVLQLLIADESNPRSIVFQLATLLHQMNRLQESEQANATSTERDLALNAISAVRATNMENLARRADQGSFPELDELMTQVKTMLWELSDALTARYFANLTACRLTSSS